MIAPSFYSWQQTFHVSPSELGMLLAIVAIAELVINTLYGKLYRHYHAYEMLIVGLLLIAGSSLLTSLSQGYWQLFAVLALEGIGMALAIPTLNLLLLDFVNENWHNRGASALSLARDLGGFSGNGIAIFAGTNSLFGFASWRGAFFLAFFLQMCVLIYLVINASKHPLAKKPAFRWQGLRDLFSMHLIKACMQNKMLLLLLAAEFMLFIAVGTLSFLLLLMNLMQMPSSLVFTYILIFSLSCLAGYTLLGYAADKVTLLFGTRGKIYLAMGNLLVSCFLYTLFFFVAQKESTGSWLYALLIIMIGLFGRMGLNATLIKEWCASDMLPMSLAHLRFVQLIAVGIAPPLCGWAAEEFFGYQLPADNLSGDGLKLLHAHNVEALSASMGSIILIAFAIAFLLYHAMAKRIRWGV